MRLGSVALLFGIFDIGVGVAWLVVPGGEVLYVVNIVLLGLESAAILGIVLFGLAPVRGVGSFRG